MARWKELFGMARSPAEMLEPGRPLAVTGVADAAEGLVCADLARAVAAQRHAPATSLLVICRDGTRMATLARALSFFAPDLAVLEFPAWDCLPYDRVSPHAGAVAQRMTALSRLAHLARARAPGAPEGARLSLGAARREPGPARGCPRQIAGGDAVALGRAGPGHRYVGYHGLARAQWLRARLDRARGGRLCGARRHHR